MEIRQYISPYLEYAGLGLFIFAAFFIAFTGFGASNKISAELKRVEKAEPGDCKACHGKEKMLPNDHVITKRMKLPQCEMCHVDTGEGLTSDIRRKMPLGHTHQLSGIKCAGCHGMGKAPDEEATQKCLSCHESYDKLIAQTAKTDPNPHDSHYGEMDCDLCHHQHSRSEDFCAQCHDFNFVVP